MLRGSREFELPRFRVIGVQLYVKIPGGSRNYTCGVGFVVPSYKGNNNDLNSDRKFTI